MDFFFLLFFNGLAKATEHVSFFEQVKPPEDISVHGHLIEWLFNYTTYMNIFFFFLVCAGLFGFSYLYNHRRHPKAYYTYGNKKIHILVATLIGLAVFLAIDMNITRISNDDFTGVFAKWPDKNEDVVKVEVMAQQWMWNFRYAGKDGAFNTEDDIVMMNDLRVPAGKKVVFQLISKDVIHSLYLPNARRKVDAIPGRITRMWVHLTKPGVYDIACAEMCGTYHYRMQARLTVYSQEDYQAWLEEEQSNVQHEYNLENPEFFWGWKWDAREGEAI